MQDHARRDAGRDAEAGTEPKRTRRTGANKATTGGTTNERELLTPARAGASFRVCCGLNRDGIRTRKWTDREGVERYATEIHVTPYGGAITFLDGKRDSDERTPSRPPEAAPAPTWTTTSRLALAGSSARTIPRRPTRPRPAETPALPGPPALEPIMYDRTPESPFPDICRTGRMFVTPCCTAGVFEFRADSTPTWPGMTGRPRGLARSRTSTTRV